MCKRWIFFTSASDGIMFTSSCEAVGMIRFVTRRSREYSHTAGIVGGLSSNVVT